MTPKISIERFASLRAGIERSGDLERVLEGAGLLRSEWTAVERHWQSALAREVAGGGRELSERYLEAFFGAQRPAERIDEPEAREGSAPAQVAVPTYLAARPAAMVGPSVISAPAPAPRPAPPPAVFAFAESPRSGFGGETFVAAAAPISARSLPFAGSLAAAPLGSSVAPRLDTGTKVVEGDAQTQPVSGVGGPQVRPGLPVLSVEQYAWVTATLRKTNASDLEAVLTRLRLTAATRSELQGVWSAHMEAHPHVRAAFMRLLAQQFEGQASAPPISAPPISARPISAPLSDAEVLARMKAAMGNLNPDETQMAAPIAMPGPTLPFASAAASIAVKPAAAVSPAAQVRPSEQAGFTVAGSSGARPSMPFARAAAPNPKDLPPGWTLARYATLCFDLHASGMTEAEVLAMAQLTQTQRMALDAYWQNRMTEEPALRAEWKAFADRREAELRQARGGGR